MTVTLETSPIKFQFKRKLEHVDDSTKQQMKWKYKRMEENLRKKFAESIAPGQSEDFLAMLNQEQNETEDPVPDEFQKLLDMYNYSDEMARLVILSVIDHTKYSKQFLSDVFGCSKYKIEQARKWKDGQKGLTSK